MNNDKLKNINIKIEKSIATFKKEQVIDLYDETEMFKNELLNIIKTF